MRKKIHEKIYQTARHPLIYGSSFIFIGGLTANFFNFLFNQQMVVRLSVQDYGILASILAFINLPGFAFGAVGPVIISFAGSLFAEKKLDKVKRFFLTTYKIAGLCAIILCVLFFATVSNISSFFHISSISLLIIAFCIIIVTLFNSINQSFLQAKLVFKFIAVNNVISALLKLVLSLVFVVIGFQLHGVIYAIAIAYFAAYLLTFIPMRFLIEEKTGSYETHPTTIMAYSIKASIALFSLTALISTDILLAKHFLSDNQAGLYAILSLLGKVIFYFAAPIGTVMFPLVVQKKQKGESYHGTFLLAICLSVLPSLAICLFYFIDPTFVIHFFLQKERYNVLSPYLGYFSLLMVLYIVLTLLVNFYLSLKKTFVYIPLFIAAILQAIMIVFLHNSFWQIISVNFTIEIMLLVILFAMYKFIAINK